MFVKEATQYFVHDGPQQMKGAELRKDTFKHGLRTPNEGKNQRNLKIWANVAVPKNLGVGVDFWPCSEGDFLTGHL